MKFKASLGGHDSTAKSMKYVSLGITPHLVQMSTAWWFYGCRISAVALISTLVSYKDRHKKHENKNCSC